MNKISKGREPQAWLEYRKTPGAAFDAIRELKTALLEEQGHLCAYCMRRISMQGETGEQMRVEHVMPRKYTSLVMDYRNLVACCSGTISGTHGNDVHCDRRKGEREISFDLFSDAFVETLSYSSGNGRIRSSNAAYDAEINEILGLNNRRLADNRHRTLLGVINRLDKRKGWSQSAVLGILRDWEEPHSRAGMREFKEYNGIVVWFLKRWLNRRRN